MTARERAIALGFAIVWAAFMVWWSADYSAANIIIFSVMGVLLGFLWTWFMKRMGYFR